MNPTRRGFLGLLGAALPSAWLLKRGKVEPEPEIKHVYPRVSANVFSDGEPDPGYVISAVDEDGNDVEILLNYRLYIKPKTGESSRWHKDAPLPDGWRWF